MPRQQLIDAVGRMLGDAGERRPARGGIADRLGQGRFLREPAQAALQPAAQVVEQRAGPCLAYFAPMIRRLAADAGFDCVERADARERLGRQGRAVRLVDVVELASHVRPAGRFLNPAAGVERFEPGIGVGLEDADEGAQKPPWMFAAAVR